MSNSIIRIVVAAAVAVSGGAPGAQAYRHAGSYTPQIEGSGENQSVAHPSAAVFGAVQPRAVITGSGENQSVEHQGVPAPTPPGYVARIVGGGENVSVMHFPSGG
ncbi:hypothetical protein GXW74_13510 [Roseomonas eburnea]|uniref:Uncharacterized protein n=1 Tax=Neoroseomonas eburnea TaxID=1346889 RepID=A0A9X9XCS1_9PROT|nr:hypothetical protein [Neoroseomonas eburnea]MBR0681507.1 hypothetical protein [Neoroseomonas eburnea]